MEGTKILLDAARAANNDIRVIFTSSLAVFGGDLPSELPPLYGAHPQSTYGAFKAIGELLISEYTRKGYINGIALRLPTISVRPGKPNSAASSFCSGIIREPVNGLPSDCPVPLDTRLWLSSPAVIIENLFHALKLSTTSIGNWRVLDMPGVSVTVSEMLDSLEAHAGIDARRRVSLKEDPIIKRIVCSWPAAIDTTPARKLGFSVDSSFDAVIQDFVHHNSPDTT